MIWRKKAMQSVIWVFAYSVFAFSLAVAQPAQATSLDWKRLNELRMSDPEAYRKAMEEFAKSQARIHGYPYGENPVEADTSSSQAKSGFAAPSKAANGHEGDREKKTSEKSGPPGTVAVDQVATVTLSYSGEKEEVAKEEKKSDTPAEASKSGTEGEKIKRFDVGDILYRREAARQERSINDPAMPAEDKRRRCGGGIVGALNCVTARIGEAGGGDGGGEAPSDLGDGLGDAYGEPSLDGPDGDDWASEATDGDSSESNRGEDGEAAGDAKEEKDATASASDASDEDGKEGKAVLEVQVKPKLTTDDDGQSFTLKISSRGRLKGEEDLEEDKRQRVQRDAGRVSSRLRIWQKYLSGQDAAKLRQGESLVIPLALPFAGLDLLELDTPIDVVVSWRPGDGLELRFVAKDGKSYQAVSGPLEHGKAYYVEAKYKTPPRERDIHVRLDWGHGNLSVPVTQTKEKKSLYRSAPFLLSRGGYE